MNSIVIYDSPKNDNDIEKIRLTFDDGQQIEFDDIYPNGSSSVIEFEEKLVKEFDIEVLECSGEEPGFTEIEAFYNEADTRGGFIKLACDDNFMYDYYLKKGDEVKLSTYTYPKGIECNILIDGKPFTEDTYVYDGKQHIVRTQSDDGRYYDEAIINNMSLYRELLIKITRTVEKYIK